MAKTGESYTAARVQALRKAVAADSGSGPVEPATREPSVPAGILTSDESVRKATGRSWLEWLAILDAWGARERKHPDIVRWLMSEQGVGGWWAQSVTGGFERARGMRAVRQMPDGFAVGATRTIATTPARALRPSSTPECVTPGCRTGVPVWQGTIIVIA